jgi:hypothetical protein
MEEFELILKWLIAITGLLSVVAKMADTFSQIQKKKNLKTDLELIEKINLNNLKIEDRDKLKEQPSIILEKFLSLQETQTKWFDVLYAIILFVGFGWWTVFIYEMNSGFSPWAILTGFVSLVGFSLLVDTKWDRKKDDKTLFKITVMSGIGLGITILGVGLLTGAMVRLTIPGYTHWYILVSVLILLGLKALFDSFKFEKQ